MVDRMDNFELAPPLDLTHHYSDVTQQRKPSAIKGFYKYFAIPGIGNLAGGLPNPGYFPFDTLESSSAQPSRFLSSLPSSTSAGLGSREHETKLNGKTPLNNPAPTHLLVPHDSSKPNKLDRIDISTALQYGTASGYPPLASFLNTFALKHLHPNIPYKDSAGTILTCGNTDGFAKTIECFTNTWSETCGRPVSERQGLLCERFAYMSAIQTARPRGLNIVPIAIDGEGMLAYGDDRCLYNVLADWNVERDGGKRPHIMYTVTMGQNPTSGLLSVKRRKEIYEICQKFDVLIVEDDPYFYIQFPHAANELSQQWRDGQLASVNHFAEHGTNYQTSLAVPVRGTVSTDNQKYTTTRMKHGVSSGYEFLDSLVPSYLSLDVDGRVIRLDTFSKTIAPGCRLGWITAQPEFIDKLLRITESSTQQPSGFVQAMVAEMLIGPDHKETYEALRRDKSRKRGETPSTGWKMDGWVRWLDGLRGNYERRMRAMTEVLERGKSVMVSERISSSDERRMKIIIRGTRRAHLDPDLPTCSRLRATSQNSDIKPDTDPDADFEMLSQLQIFDFNIPMAGMFLWVHFNFETHPLAKKFTLPELAQAFWVFQTRKPYLILTAPGTIFAPTEEIRLEDAWQYFRMCFAAVEEKDIKEMSENFVKAAHGYWDVQDEQLIQELLNESADEMEERKLNGLLGTTPFMC